MQDGEYLFVYGTLMRPLGHPMHRYLRASCSFLERGWVWGSLYDLGGYPGLLAPGSSKVRGEIYRVVDAAQLFGALDRYEECHESFPAPHEYRREIVRVTGESGRVYRCWAYLYQFGVSDDMKIEDGDYLRHSQRGSHEQTDT